MQYDSIAPFPGNEATRAGGLAPRLRKRSTTVGDHRNRVRYRLAFELHHIVWDDDPAGVVVTVQRWDAVNSVNPRSHFVVLENGQEAQRDVLTDTTALRQLGSRLDSLVQRVVAITDESARAEIEARTGVRHYPYCNRTDCGARRPIGSDKCGDGHSAGQSGGATMGNLGRGRRGPIHMDFRS